MVVVVLAGAIVVVPVTHLGVRSAAAYFGASLVLESGSAEIQRAGTIAARPALGGEALRAGDQVQAGPTRIPSASFGMTAARRIHADLTLWTGAKGTEIGFGYTCCLPETVGAARGGLITYRGWKCIS